MGKTLSDAWSRCFLGWHFLTFLSLWRGCLWPAAYWAGTFWAGAFLSAVTTFFAGTFTAAVAAATLAEGAFFGRKFQESCFFCSFLTSNLLILFLIFLAFLIFNNQSHLGSPFSGFHLLGPSCGCAFCTDICLLPGLSDTLMTGIVWALEVSELYALERQSLTPYLSAGSINQRPFLTSIISTTFPA